MVLWHSLGETSRPHGSAWLTAGEIERVAAMKFTKRRDEWLLARWTAKRALAGHLGLPNDPLSLSRIEIRTIIGGEAQGAPDVFIDAAHSEIGISLTDRAGWAVCALGGPDELGSDRELGCDLELVEPRSAGFVRDFLTPSEQAAVADPPIDASGQAVANLVWSAKESALKVLRTGLRRDTRSVEVSFPPDPTADGFQPLRVHTAEGRDLPGWWRRYGHFLLTVVTGRALPPPESLIDPPGLATARPSHAWLASPLADDERGRDWP